MLALIWGRALIWVKTVFRNPREFWCPLRLQAFPNYQFSGYGHSVTYAWRVSWSEDMHESWWHHWSICYGYSFLHEQKQTTVLKFADQFQRRETTLYQGWRCKGCVTYLVEDLDRVIAKCKATYQISPNSTKCEARKGKSWDKMGKEEARSLWKRKKKLAHENKSFSAPPRNVWFQVAVHQITWYRSRSAYWLLIEGSIKAHWLMTLYDLKKMIYADRSRLRRRFLSDEGAAFTLLFRFENGRARERSEREREIPLR